MTVYSLLNVGEETL